MNNEERHDRINGPKILKELLENTHASADEIRSAALRAVEDSIASISGTSETRHADGTAAESRDTPAKPNLGPAPGTQCRNTKRDRASDDSTVRWTNEEGTSVCDRCMLIRRVAVGASSVIAMVTPKRKVIGYRLV